MNNDKSRPKFTIRPSQRGRHRTVRSHNPGTRRRPPTPRVRVLSSIMVVPPHNLPSTSSAVPLQDINNNETAPIEPLPPMATPWTTPTDLEEPPVESTWRKATALQPTPMTEYPEEFRIIPGEAYEPVPIIINRDVPWELRPIDAPIQRRVRHYRNDITDPRMHDLRVEVTPCDTPVFMEPPTSIDPRFNSPRRTVDHPPPSGPLDDLIRLLDQSYGCPRPGPSTRPETPRPTRPVPPPTPQPPAVDNRFSESLQILMSLARLFEGPPPDLADAYRRYKRPNRRDRR